MNLIDFISIGSMRFMKKISKAKLSKVAILLLVTGLGASLYFGLSTSSSEFPSYWISIQSITQTQQGESVEWEIVVAFFASEDIFLAGEYEIRLTQLDDLESLSDSERDSVSFSTAITVFTAQTTNQLYFNLTGVTDLELLPNSIKDSTEFYLQIEDDNEFRPDIYNPSSPRYESTCHIDYDGVYFIGELLFDGDIYPISQQIVFTPIRLY